jgi:uncharacterized protein (DUF433 family)
MAQIDRITFDPAVMGGRPCIRGLRVTVATVLGLLAAGRSRDEILQAFRTLRQKTSINVWPVPRGAWKNVMYHW